ncbi:shikimate dehydrogenase [Novosphingobium sp. FSY-8]|uniref:Shikimate dehydrogenase (NADP(+)) n=1 Tax=Novosphingobium ovatum TaxID=1908523 RepID=A0ABW9XHE1_9SPHN|nr:shikimate dehydrogenase [Novosphingobium ovatum]NBC37977.1 shikimate dehydrogenase [Novosphingobium ovatum]
MTTPDVSDTLAQSSTQPYAEVIGDPIAQSKSPAIHGYWLRGLGIAGDYGRAHVRGADLQAYIATRRADANWRGCNVTMPHKLAVMPYLDHIDPLAAKVGAVNTVVRGANGRLTGYNTDVPGFMEPLLPMLASPTPPRRALVLGAGGAARAVVLGLIQAGLKVTLAARDVAKAQAMLDDLAPGDPLLAADMARFARPGGGAFDLVVNASPLGMVGNPPLAFDISHVAPGGVVYDIVTAPLETPLLQAARASGRVAIDGLSMLIGQADVAFVHFFGAQPPRGGADDALRAILTGAAPQ